MLVSPYQACGSRAVEQRQMCSLRQARLNAETRLVSTLRPCGLICEKLFTASRTRCSFAFEVIQTWLTQCLMVLSWRARIAQHELFSISYGPPMSSLFSESLTPTFAPLVCGLPRATLLSNRSQWTPNTFSGRGGTCKNIGFRRWYWRLFHRLGEY